MRRCCSSQINPPICKHNEEPPPLSWTPPKKKGKAFSGFKQEVNWKWGAPLGNFLVKKGFPRIWCCPASVHPFANWDVTTSLHHQLCPSESAQSGGARHVLENVFYHDKNKFLFWGLNKNLLPSVLLSWHTKTCVRKMLDGRYWRERSCQSYIFGL